MQFYLYTANQTDNPKVKLLAKDISNFLWSNECTVTQDILKADIILSIGGDGTFLSCWHYIYSNKSINTPIFGINGGRLGYLTEATYYDWKDMLLNIINKQYTIVNRPILNAKTDFKLIFPAINDVVIRSKSCSDFVISVNDNEIIQYRGDGIIVSTPMGSTGYALSAGGSLIDPNSNIIEIQGLAPHTLANRPILFDYNNVKSIKILTDERWECGVYVDGKMVGKGKVEIKPSNEFMKIAKLDNQKFEKTIKNVFGSI